MEQFEKKYKRLKLKKKALICTYFGLMALAFLTGLTGIIICGIKNTDAKFSFFMILALVLPIVMWVLFLIAIIPGKDKAREKMDAELMESNLSSDEVMEIGDRLKLDLFGVAAVKRAKELGIDHLPEGCFRDRILPTKEDMLESDLSKELIIANLLKSINEKHQEDSHKA